MSDGFKRDGRNVEARTWHGNIPMGHKYTMGVAGEEFFRRLRDRGEICATLHEGADLPTLPPRLYNPETLAPVQEWVPVSPEGIVDTFTIITRGPDSDPAEEPRVLAMVRIDGTVGGLVHWVGDCDPSAVRIGLRVRAVFEAEQDRTGALSDIRHFAPAI